MQIDSLEEIIRFVLAGNGLFSSDAPAVGAVWWRWVAEERETQRKGGGSAVVNPSNRTQREMMAQDTRQELVQCVQQKAMVRPKSDEKPDTSSMRRSNIIQPYPVREVQMGANLTTIRSDLCSRGHNGIDRKEMPLVMSQHRWIDRKPCHLCVS